MDVITYPRHNPDAGVANPEDQNKQKRLHQLFTIFIVFNARQYHMTWEFYLMRNSNHTFLGPAYNGYLRLWLGCVITYHYDDVIMGTMASQITSLTIVYLTVYSGSDKKKTSKLHVTGLCVGNSPVTGEFPAQMASNTENVSIWWRHHAIVFVVCNH